VITERKGIREHAPALAVVWAVSMVYMWLLLDRGWVPHDEGMLGQGALRILQGELPHRDFAEVYTGGLTYLNALAFRLWGVRLMHLRYMAYLAFACWIPVVYYLASHRGRAIAAGVTLTAAAWSYPNYPAAMPSWYTLYCTTGVAACLLRFVETRSARWLAGAGFLAGVACLFKIVGLYTVAGSLLFLLYLEQEADTTESTSSSPWYRLISIGGLTAFGAAVFLLVSPRLGIRELIQFVLPSWACIAFLAAGEWRVRHGGDRPRFRVALALIGPYVVGLALPILAMLGYFLVHGGLDDLLIGVLVTPFRRLTTAAWQPPPPLAILAPIAVASLVWMAERWAGAAAGRATAALVGVTALLLLVGGISGLGQIGYLTLNQSVPIIVVATIWLFWKGSAPVPEDKVASARLVLLGFLCATYTLVQYPFSTTTYFAYIAPLVILALAALIERLSGSRPRTLPILLSFLTCYAALWLTPWQFRLHNSRGLFRDTEVRTLLPGLADLKVSLNDWREYETLVPLVASRARGEFIFAGPDSPEVYFLSGARNPTRTIFDFFDDQEGRAARILHLLEEHHVGVVVINNRPLFSGPLDPALLDAFRSRYPRDSVIGRFTVRWK